jgi:hypothetical protein
MNLQAFLIFIFIFRFISNNVELLFLVLPDKFEWLKSWKG